MPDKEVLVYERPCVRLRPIGIFKPAMWKRLGQSLSAKEMIGVVGVLLLIAGALYGAYRGAAAMWHRHGVEKSIPGVLAGVRTQRDTLIGVIESYKSQFGYYPPLFTGAGATRGVVNPLCYELEGVRFDPKTAQFHIATSKDGLSEDEAQKYFNARSFSNCLFFPKVPTNFLANRPIPTTPLLKDAELFGIGVGYTEFTPEAFWEDFEFTAWRYATNPAEHNQGKFDLWIEVNVAGKHFTIGNWPEVN